jgi:hypothetical protein
MHRSSVVGFVLLISALSTAQRPQSWAALPEESDSARRAFPSELRQELGRIRQAALSDDYAYEQLQYLTDSIGPRPQGSAQAEAAVSYVAAELRKLGLEVHLEPVPVRHFLRGADAAELVEYPGQVDGTRQKIVVTALLGNSPTTEEGLTAEVVVVRNFDELKAAGRSVQGKIVLFDFPYDHRKAIAGQAGAAYGEAVRYRASGALAASRLGAAAALVRSAGDGEYRLAHTGWSADSPIPAGAVTAEDAELMARLAARGRVRMHLVLTTRQGQEAQSSNVVADLKGSEHPDEIVIVSGHLDSWDLGTGAIDDGAGLVIAMEAAELIHRLNLHPRRTIRVVAWMNEEMGTTGRDAYARSHAGEIGNHVAAIESDEGAEHPLGFRAHITAGALRQLSPVRDALEAIGATLIERVEQSPGTDIEPLAEKGVPAFSIWQSGLTYFMYHHTAADTLDKVSPAELRENAAVMAVLGYALADMAEPLERQ